MTENEYRNHSALSQSQLKLFLNGYDCFINNKEKSELYFEDKKHFNIGQAVDTLCTKGLVEYSKKFVVSKEDKPSDVILSILQMMCDNDEDFSDEKILESAKNHNFYNINDSEEKFNRHKNTVLKKVKNHKDYYDFLVSSKDKTVLSPEESAIISKCFSSIKESYSNYLIDTTPYHKNDMNYQKVLFGSIEKKSIKGMLDLLRFDHDNKKIQIIDFKTFGDFLINFYKVGSYKRRYDIQAAMYRELVLQHYGALYHDYDVEFYFIVVSTINFKSTMIKCSEEFIQHGLFGNTEYNKPGLTQLIADYKFYEEYEEEIPIKYNAEMTFGGWQHVQSKDNSIENELNI